MKKIEIDDKNLVNIFFGGMDSDCLQEINNLVEQGGVLLNPVTGELERKCVGLGIYTDYFNFSFVKDESYHPYPKGNTNIYVASRKSVIGEYEYICVEGNPIGSDGWDSAQLWNPNSEECYGSEFRVYQFQIEVEEDKWEFFPIWFEDRESAIIYLED